jgi:hypothetical protein
MNTTPQNTADSWDSWKARILWFVLTAVASSCVYYVLQRFLDATGRRSFYIAIGAAGFMLGMLRPVVLARTLGGLRWYVPIFANLAIPVAIALLAVGFLKTSPVLAIKMGDVAWFSAALMPLFIPSIAPRSTTG